jgi:hypothetical protein
VQASVSYGRLALIGPVARCMGQHRQSGQRFLAQDRTRPGAQTRCAREWAAGPANCLGPFSSREQ